LYIKKLGVKNFRCFAETEVEFNYPGKETAEGEEPLKYPNVNLFLGDNGSGKTSAFRALVLGTLAPVLNTSGLVADNWVRYQPENPDAPHVYSEREATISVDLLLSELDTTTENLSKLKNNPFHLTTTIRRRKHNESLIPDESIEKDATFWQKIYDNESDAFFFLAYSAHRHSGSAEGAKDKYSPRYQRVAGIFDEHLGLSSFDVTAQNLAEYDLLDAASEMLNTLLPKEVKLTNNKDHKGRILFCIQHNSGESLLPFDSLSDGYKIFIIWLWDFIYSLYYHFIQRDTGGSFIEKKNKLNFIEEKIAILNSFIDETNSLYEFNDTNKAKIIKKINHEIEELTHMKITGEKLYEESIEIYQKFKYAVRGILGVVIVDELDLFLHPSWQREIIGKIATTFPHIQFFFSTHSPIVAGTVEAKNRYITEETSDGAVIKQYEEEIYGMTANQVLTSSYFNLHSTRAPGTGTLADLAIKRLNDPKFVEELHRELEKATN
jgi:AAA domain, putative AbiEii toxin, Type IV TA system